MAEAKAELQDPAEGRAARRERKPFLDRSVRERWNDYGIGLLLQGDLRGAEAAFLKVTEMEPELRRRLGERGARAAPGRRHGGAPRPMLRKALAIDPKLAKTHFFLGSALKAQGRYDEALEHTRVAAGASTRATASCTNQVGRAAVPEAPAPGSDRRASEGPRRRPRGPAGALQPDAGLPGSGERGDGEEAPGALRALQGGRGGAVHHRARTGSCTRTTTTSGRRSTSTARSRPARRPGPRGARRRLSGSRGARRARLPARRRLGGRGASMRRSLTVVSIVAAATSAVGRRRGVQAQAPAAPASSSATSRAPRASRSATRTGPSGRSTCPRRWARASCSSTTTATAAPDLFFVNSTRWPGRPEKPGLPALYRNDGKGRFTRRHAGGGPGGRDVRPRRRGRRLRQRRPRRPLRHRPRRRTACSATWAAGRSPT